MIYIGIDPGLSGGIGAVDDNSNIIIAEAMPTMPSPVSGKNIVDGGKLFQIIHAAIGDRACQCVIEKVGAMPGQGVTSMFSFGMAYGSAVAIVQALQYRHEFVTPQAWKKNMALGKDKGRSLGMAMRLWPALSFRKKDDGIAEALLLAEWLRTK